MADEVKSALPPDFNHVRYVAKFVNGELVGLQAGLPEEAIQRLLGTEPVPANTLKSCEDGTCTEPEPPTSAKP